ncbi:MAG TPA: DoxX family protein [Chloroflexota bacterium]|nr:DoxX family protein [Chloroflexota bacterium]
MKLQLGKRERDGNAAVRSDVGLLALRLVAGGLMAGHGAQKLFGWFGGHGLEGTGRVMESLGFQPGKRWATRAGLGEFTGGVLTALGLFHPIGQIIMLGPMAVATARVHWGKEIWTASGGAEAPLLYSASAVCAALAGPGRFSLDRLLGIKVSGKIIALAAAGTAIGTVIAIRHRQARETAGEPEQGEGPVRVEIEEIDSSV